MEMDLWFRNIDPERIDDAQLGAAVHAMWAAGDQSLITGAAERLLQQPNPLGRCAVFDTYSYSCTTGGADFLPAFSGLRPAMTTLAREILHGIWSSRLSVAGGARDCIVASAMHMIWRAVEIEDAALVLRALREERHWRVVWPSVSAASLIRGNDPSFDREVSPLLLEVTCRTELSPLIRRLAIEALAQSASASDLGALTELLRVLPVPLAASCALVLLDASGEYRNLVTEVAAGWSPSDEYPVWLVLDRLNRVEGDVP
jgi:hypothetical protein